VTFGEVRSEDAVCARKERPEEHKVFAIQRLDVDVLDRPVAVAENWVLQRSIFSRTSLWRAVIDYAEYCKLSPRVKNVLFEASPGLDSPCSTRFRPVA
jgi:hypothetical protein